MMVAPSSSLVAPSPRPVVPPAPLLLAPLRIATDLPRTAMSPPRTPVRLMSPIQLGTSSFRPPLSLPCPSSPCTPAPTRRRRPTHSIRHSRRRRPQPACPAHHAPAHDCFLVKSTTIDSFDRLPWISMLDAPSALGDLSQIADAPATPGGPVRRRKTSLRSSPMAADLSELAAPDAASAPDSALAAPAHRRTPHRPALDPLHTQFRALMPILPSHRAVADADRITADRKRG
ncbi:hypothetical protein PUNSTDRAFT_127145 [Punctularia strigosozonata HHB-11173 SS5]|uniref:uncharacterized protein n=1 Tax=Punctularia strigosozonata (strain HHB-11173) TaxID=741275 RepID=UPI0004416306|nr:uncharacterized protein PUNSTDRAFT_127145 [Punctularia strigosozonata HHB-11173 SS5]EIN07444.1 hypothetical protein PUNSTDRAFT_127145 [Punctularia strigosozonata HHB-11173 SS5]